MSDTDLDVYVAVVDENLDSLRSVRSAMALVRGSGTVHALQIATPGIHRSDQVPGTAGSDLEALQVRLSTRLADYGLGAARAVVRQGDPVQVILDHLQATDASAVVMTRRPWTPVRNLIFGRPSERVMLRSSCPVLILPLIGTGADDALVEELPLIGRPPRVDGPVVVAWDGSETSHQAVEVAASMVSHPRRLHVVQILEALKSPALEGTRPVEGSPRRLQLAREQIDRVLMAADLGEAQVLVAVGTPARHLVSIAASVGAVLIVVGSPPYHRRGGSLMAPAVLRLVNRSFCPVLQVGPALDPAQVQHALEAAAVGFSR